MLLLIAGVVLGFGPEIHMTVFETFSYSSIELMGGIGYMGLVRVVG